MLGISPFSSTIPALEAVPTRVPIVSNISIIQNVIISVIAVNHPISTNPEKLNLNKVVSAISANGGTKEAPLSDANGLVSRKIASPAQ